VSLEVAYFTPLPPQRSGIADYSASLLPYLAELVTLDVFVDTPESAHTGLPSQCRVRSIADFLAEPRQRWQYDVCLYHMGNQPLYHEYIYRALLRCPGVVVLHDVNLSGFCLHRPAPTGGHASFIREMAYAYGTKGAQAAREILAGGATGSLSDYPLFKRVADVSTGLIVHTASARERILLEAPRAQVAEIPLGAFPEVPRSEDTRPGPLGRFPASAVVLACFGYIAPSKRVDVVLHAVARLHARFGNLRLVLVGQQVDGYDLAPLIERLGLGDTVHLTGFVDGPVFRAYLDAIDIGVNLRTGPSGGEMSASAVRLLAAGKPTIVSKLDGFADLPDDCVVKIDQNEHEVDQLVDAIGRLIENPQARVDYGKAAQRYVARELSFSDVAAKYVAFIRECLVERGSC
jgi:glycosyltransferase involved in cell wall biosynthesis